MNKKVLRRPPLSLAERSGLLLLAASIGLSCWDARWALPPLGVFLALCLVAPFLPRFGFFLPIISHGRSGRRAVALTFDDGPDPASTPVLLDLLAEYDVKAAFFVVGEKAAAHPEIMRNIIEQGHTVGNHSYTHDPLILLKGSRRLYGEIEKTQIVLQNLGVVARAFRPPVGITSPRLPDILHRLNLCLVNFSCRAYDFGNRRPKHLAARILKRVKPGDIILLHDTGPRKAERFACWQNEVRKVFKGLTQQGLAVLPLEELIGRRVMEVERGE